MGILKYWSKPNYSAELIHPCFVPGRSATWPCGVEATDGNGVLRDRWPALVAPISLVEAN